VSNNDKNEVILQKLNVMHTDIILMKASIKTTREEVADHEMILRGESKRNGIISEIASIKVSHATTLRMWGLFTGAIVTIAAISRIMD
jgi:hypothetical protein